MTRGILLLKLAAAQRGLGRGVCGKCRQPAFQAVDVFEAEHLEIDRGQQAAVATVATHDDGPVCRQAIQVLRAEQFVQRDVQVFPASVPSLHLSFDPLLIR